MEIKATLSIIDNKVRPATITITEIDLSDKKQVEQLKKSVDHLAFISSTDLKPNEPPQHEKG